MSRRSKNKPRQIPSAGPLKVSPAPPAAVERKTAEPGASPGMPVPAPAPAGLSAAAPWWQKDRYIALLFFAALLLVYSRAFNGAFIWDDDMYISQNPALRSLHGLWQIWFEPWSAGHQYYPLSYTGFWVGWHLWGMHTAGYHLVNILLHASASVLLWQVLKSLKVRGALLAAALFALHPVSVMSVAWMNEMKNTLSCSLALGAMWAYLRFDGLGVYARPEGAKRPWGWYAPVLGLFVLAMFAKTAVSFLPVSLLLIIWWQRGRIGWREARSLLPMVAIVAGMGLLTIAIERNPHGGAGAVGKDFTVTFPEKLIVSGHSFFFYLGKFLLPVNLSFVYTRWKINPWDVREYLWPAAMLGVLVALWRLRGRIGRAPLAAAIHFYLCTSFLIFMVVLYHMRYSFVSDHWTYFGSMSLFALAGAVLAKGAGALGGWEKPFPQALAGGLFLLLGAMSWHQCIMYDNFDTLWRWTIARNPGCWMAENNLGNDLLHKGRADEAMGHFRRAMELKPDYVLAMDNLGDALMQKHRVDDALIQYKNALAIKPDNPETLNDIGFAYQQKGNLDEAVKAYRKASELLPGAVLVRNNLASALQQGARVAEAIDVYRKTLDVMPDNLQALTNLSYLLTTSVDPALRNPPEALALAQKANQLAHGRSPVILDTLAAAYAGLGRYSDAVDVESQAISIALAQGNTTQANIFKKHLTLHTTRQSLREK